MKDFKEVGIRFSKYMKSKGLGVNKTAEILGFSGSQISNIKNGKVFGSDKLFKILNVFSDLNPEWLLTGKGKMLKNETINNPDSSYHKEPQVITITPDNEDNIILVPVKAQAGYLNGYNDPNFIGKLPSYNLPNMRNGVFRMFQVEGHSMYPTMHSNSYVVGQFVEDWVNDIKDNRIYVVISESDGVVIKRVLNRIEKYNNLYCKSDNRKEYPSFPIGPKDIKEVWECKMLLSYEFLDPSEIYDKVHDLEAEMLHLKDLYKKTLQKNT